MGIATRDWSNYAPEGGDRSLGGSGHYRCGLVAKVLAGMGHDVALGTLIVDTKLGEVGVRTWDEEHHWGCDLILLQRWMFADLPHWIKRGRANGQVILNDVDDWFEGLDPSNMAFQTSHPKMNDLENRNHYRKVLAAGDGIVCSTPFLAEKYRRLCPTIVVRNRLDLDRWTPQEPRDGPPTLGWVGALPWRSSGDLAMLRGFLGPFIEKHDLRVRHHGALAVGWEFALATGIDPTRLDQEPMVDIGDHEAQFQGIDLLLVPLGSMPFNESKSCLKGMQAAAAGVPFIATPTPEYKWLFEERGIGALAKSPKDWVRLMTGYLDPDARAWDAGFNATHVRSMGLPGLTADWEALLDHLGVRRLD